MPAAAPYPSTMTRTRRTTWVAVSLALLLILAQAVVLEHQSGHPVGGIDVDCPICLTGNALDHAGGTAGVQPAPAGGATLPMSPLAARVPRPTLLRATARGPPLFA